MTARHHAAAAIEIREVLSLIPMTQRKALQVAIVRQNGIDLIELRSVNLNPNWQPSVKDHRTVIRRPALRRVLAALEAACVKIGENR